MPVVKGLEFRAVAVVACDSGIIPSDNRLESVTDEGPWNVLVSTTYRDDKGYENAA